MRWILAGTLTGLAALLVGLALFVTIERKPADNFDYDRDTPDAVIESIFLALERGDAGSLHRFVYAENPDIELVLNEVGRLLGSLQKLSGTIRERFPEEVARLRADAQRRADSGAPGGVRGIFDAARAANRGQGAPTRSDPVFNAAAGAILADPLGWLERAKGRVSTIQIADQTAAVLIDDRPAFGVGMTMRLDDGVWRIEPPLRAPLVARFAPRTTEEHQVLASMLRVLDNTVVELDADLRRGEANSLDEAASLAGRKAFGPIAIVFIAYQRALEARGPSGQQTRPATPGR